MNREALYQQRSLTDEIRQYKGAYEAYKRRKYLLILLAEWRKQAGLSTAQVANRMGIKESTLVRIEKNIDQASFNTLARYATACGVQKAELFF